MYLVVCAELAGPAGSQVVHGETQVAAAVLEQDLLGFVQQTTAKLTLYLHHTLKWMNMEKSEKM